MNKKTIDLGQAPTRFGTQYPPPFDGPCQKRERVRLGLAAGLSHFGVNLLRLAPGQWSSQRHYHSREDEFVFVVQGEVVLVTDGGEEILRAGDCAGFPHGEPNGHHLQNRSTEMAVILEVGSNDEEDVCEYPDIDLRAPPGGFVHKDGRPYPGKLS
ncbi:MAG: cupin domain-containing protein [Myxococcales bacterium]|jgi:uncharacterized cupin superfamily protein|nr:cupin domain-containing protein [Myxococcales bacterium]